MRCIPTYPHTHVRRLFMMTQACNSVDALRCGGGGHDHDDDDDDDDAGGDAAWRWQVRRPMTTARKLHGLVAHRGRVYAFGGLTVEGGHRPSRDCEAYDPATDTWTAIRPLPVGACV